MAAIKAYRADDSLVSIGDWSHALDCGQVARGQSGAAVVAHIAADVGYQRLGSYIVSLSGVYATRYRLSADLATWSDWGASLTLPGPITATPTTLYVQKRALDGDPAGAAATQASLLLLQDSIVATSSNELAAGADTGIALDSEGTWLTVSLFDGNDIGASTDTAALIVLGVLSGDDAALAADAGTLNAAGSIEGADAAVSADAGEFASVTVLAAASETGQGAESGGLAALVPFVGADSPATTDTGELDTYTAGKTDGYIQGIRPGALVDGEILFARKQGDGTRYRVMHLPVDSDWLYLQKVDSGGTPTQIGSWEDMNWDTWLVDVSCRLTLSGTTVSVQVGGVTKISVTDSTISSAGDWGSYQLTSVTEG